MYRAEKVENSIIRWNLLKKLDNFSSDFEADDCWFYLPFFSPDFSQHIDMDRKQKLF